MKRVVASIRRRPGLAVFLLLTALYLPTTSFGLPFHIDPAANVLTAWELGTQGDVVLDRWEGVTGPDHFNVANQLVDTDRGPVSKYPPGAALLAAPAYSVVRSLDVVTIGYPANVDGTSVERTDTIPLPEVWPGSVVAAVATAGAMALLTVLMVPWTGPAWAVTVGLVTGLGTSLWSVAADALWQHGPAALWLTAGLVLFRQERWLAGSAAFGLAVLTRPQTAVIVAVVGIWMALDRKSVWVLIKAGVPAGLGALAYVLYNRWLFQDVIVYQAGGYWVDAAVSRTWWSSIEAYLRAFVDPGRGVLVWSPIVAVALLGVHLGWRAAPALVRAAAVAGLLYLIVQVRGNGYSGGEGFQWYRYQLEALVTSAPLLGIAIRELWNRRDRLRPFVAATAGYSVLVHAYAAITT